MRWNLHVNLNDSLNRFFFLKYEFLRLILKTLIKNWGLSPIIKQFIFFKFNKIKKYCYNTKIINRCLLSGRSYFILSKFKYSRFFLRYNYNLLKISGLKRKSW